MSNVVTFPEPAGLFPKRRTIPVVTSEPEEEEPTKDYWRRPNMHTYVFRSLALILESSDADLVRDVCLDLDKAEKKLKGIRRRLQGVQEQAAAQVQLLTTAETKLNAAIIAAQTAPVVDKNDAYRDLLAAFGKLDRRGQESVVHYLKTQV